MADNEIRVVITGVASDLRRALDGAKGDLGGLKAAIKDVPNHVKIDVQAQTAIAVERLRALREIAKDVPKHINIEASADTGVAEAKLRLLERQARQTEEAIARAQLGGLLSAARGGGGGGVASALSSAAGGIPFGRIGLGVAAAPLAAAGVGSLTAIAGSAGAAALGAGAIGTAGLGAMLAGIGPLVALSGGLKDAIKLSGQLEQAQKNLASAQQIYGGQNKQLTTAQNNYNAAVAAFGPNSKAALTAHGQLLLAQQKQVALAPQIVSAQNAITKLQLQANPAVLSFAKSWGEVGDAMQSAEQNVLPAFATALRPVLDTVTHLLPTLERMAKISLGGISAGLKPLLDFLNSAGFRASLIALSDTFARIAGPLGQAFTSLFRAFLNVAVAASPYLVQIAKAFAAWAKSFADSLAPGQHLSDLIGGLVSQLHSWWDLAKALGGLMVTIFRDGASTGQGLVDKLTALLDKWNAWLNTQKGQDAVRKFFADSARLLGGVLSALAPVVKLIASMSVGLIPAMTLLLKPIAELLNTISHWVNDLSKGLPPVIKALPGLAVAAGVLASWVALKAVVVGVGTAIARAVVPGAAAAAAPAAGGLAGGAAGGAAAGGATALLGGVATVALIGAIAAAVGISLQHYLNKPIVAPAGSTPTQVATKLDAGGAGFATIDLLKQLQAKGAFSSAANEKAGFSAGEQTALAWIKGVQGVRFPTEFLLGRDIAQRLANPPANLTGAAVTAWRNQAAKQMLAYATTLEQQGKLPKHSVDNMIATLEQQFPGLIAFLARAGSDSASAIAKHMKLDEALKNLKGAVGNMRDQWGDMAISANLTNANINKNTAQALSDLRLLMHSKNRQIREEATAEYNHLESQINVTWGRMVSSTEASVNQMHALIAAGSQHAAEDAATNFAALAGNIFAGMKSGVLNAGQGSVLLARELNSVLSTFGSATHVPTPVILTLTQAGLQGVSTGTSGRHLAAGGGYIGAPGQKGRDQVPIVVGAGEAVLNHSQQNVVNAALAAQGIAGLPEVFSKVTTPHYMAQGGYATGGQVNAATGVGASGSVSQSGAYVFPFPKGVSFSWQRIDQGQDLEATPGAPVVAIAPGIVSQASDRFGGFGPFYPTEQITAGPLAGRGVYYGHTKIVKTGAVAPGDIISYTQQQANTWTAAPAGWLEIGFLPYGSMSAGNEIAPLLHQLAAGHMVTGVGGGGLGGAAAPVWKNIAAPGVKGTGTIADIVRAAMKKETDAANAFGQKQMGALGGSAASVGGPVQNQIAAALASVGFNKVAIAGIMGNISQESSYNPNDPGGGLFQFTPSIPGANGSVAEQINLMMSHGGSGLVGAMNAQGSPAAAATYFMNNFERPGIPALGNRIAGANAAFAAGFARGGYAGGGAVTGRVSWFNDHTTASGIPADTTPGISLRIPGTSFGDAANRALMRHFFDVNILGHRATLEDIDLGPNESTGRSIDVSAPGVYKLGFTTGNFPTDAIGTATMVGSGGSSSSSASSPSVPKSKPIVVPPVAIPYEKAGRLVGAPLIGANSKAKPGHPGYAPRHGRHRGQVFQGAKRWASSAAIRRSAGAEKLDAAFKIIADPQAYLDGIKDPFADWTTALDNQFSLIGSILSEQDAAGNPHSTLLGSNGPPSDLSLLNPKPSNLSNIKGIGWPTFRPGQSAYDAETINRYTEMGVLQGKAGSEGGAIALLGKAIKDRQDRQKAIATFLKQQLKRRNTLQAHKDKIASELRALAGKDLRQRLAAAISGTASGARVADARTRIADTEDTIRHLQGLKSAESARGPAANVSLIRDYQHKISAEQDFISRERRYISAQQKTQPSGVSSALEAIAKHNLSDESTLLGKEISASGKVLSQFGGSSTRAGTAGLYGQITTELGTLQSGQKTFKDDLAAILTSQIPGLALQLRDFAAAKSAAASAQGPDLSALNALLTTQNANLASEFALSQSQYGTLAGFMPLLQGRLMGTFATGIDRVPQTGPYLLHRDEMVIPDPYGPQGNRAAATVHTAEQPIQIVIEMGNDEKPLMRVIDARMNQKALQIISDHSGQRARLMAGVRRP